MSWYTSTIIIALVIYSILLYGSNFYGFNNPSSLSTTSRKLLYSLSFTVYTSAWMFFGVTETSPQLWNFIPIFLGPALVFLFFHRVFAKILIISKQENIASIPDFLAKRYGNSRMVAIVVSLLCLAAFIPYIALQIRATISIIALVFEQNSGFSVVVEQYLVLGILVFLSVIIVIIAGRQGSNIVEHQYKSFLYTSAIGAILKLLAFVSIGLLACYMLYQGIEYNDSTFTIKDFKNVFLKNNLNLPDFILQTGIIMMAVVCLPHLFQAGATKTQKIEDLDTARWAFPFYLLIMTLCIIPVIIVGNLLGDETTNQYWLINLPVNHPSILLTVIALLGGLSATVGTTVICCFSLSRMISNHVLLNSQTNILSKVSFPQLQGLRWLCIIVVLLLSFACYLCFSNNGRLTDIGQICFAGIAQLAPAMTGALYWKTANRQGVLAGLFIGVGIWLTTLLFPLLLHEKLDSFTTIPIIEWLQSLLPFNLSYITFCSVIALICNFGFFGLFSSVSKKRVTEHWQATKFINQDSSSKIISSLVVTLDDLFSLSSRFIGEKKASERFKNFAQKREISLDLASKADSQWILYIEHLLAEKLGASTARAMVKSAIEGREMQVDDVFLIVDEASEVFHFNRMLLQGALERITQGISVIDKSLHLVAWNHRYIDLFDFPEGLIQVGRPIADIIYYNAKRGMCGPGKPEEHVVKRLRWMALGQSHISERQFPNGCVIEMIGNPMPGGGFVTSFTDITAFRQAEQALTEANERLEQRVQERTKALSELNNALRDAKGRAEFANESKTRFLAAVSHDLMQPLNAARLFSAALSQEHLPHGSKDLVKHLESSLHSAEELISDLLDMSRLESGRITPQRQTVALNNLFEMLNVEFSALAPKDIQFKVHFSHVFVDTDSKLLRRILQNFLTNAFRYGQGRVILGVRRLPGQVRIEVWDQGPGIPVDKRHIIFEEFKRLDSHQTRAEKGLGLGLAIADGFCKLLNHPINLRSWLGKGSVFSVTVPIAENPLMLNVEQIDAILTESSTISKPNKTTNNANVLCIDNEESILMGMETLLSRWGCNVALARTKDECQKLLEEGYKPQLVLIDYHLDHGFTGTELMGWIRGLLGDDLPGIIISADNHPEILAIVQKAKLDYVKKPIKPAQLRALLSRYLSLK